MNIKNNKSKIIFNKGFLSSGKDLKLSDNVYVHHPTVEDYWSLGNGFDCEETYWSYVSTIMCDPYQSMVELDDMGLNYQDLCAFDVFVIKWQNVIKVYNENKEAFDAIGYDPLTNIKNALKFFLVGNHDFNLVYFSQDEQYVLLDENSYNSDTGYYEYYLTKDMFNRMSEFIKQINMIDESYKIRPANEMFRKMLIEDTREELERRSKYKKDDEEYNYISTSIDIVCCIGSSVNYITIGQYHMYQLLKTSKVKIKKIHYDQLMSGAYAGTVDIKKVNKKELTWIE
jgi:hypothetical protein